MKRMNVYLTVAVLLLSMQSIAQEKDKVSDKSQFKRLYIGDTVPMESIVFNNVRNYPGGTAKLSDFKGKYIILDFWTKYCSSCIAAFPKMGDLQDSFQKDIQILLVTKNSEEELGKLLDNSKYLRETTLPVIMGDEVLSKFVFPHESVPYHVWLDKTGKVIATTYGMETNYQNLHKLVAGTPVKIIVKNEIFSNDPIIDEIRNSKLSLLRVGRGRFSKHLKYYSQLPEWGLYDTDIKQDLSLAIPSLKYYSMFMNWIPGDINRSGSQLLLSEDQSPLGFRFFNYTLNELYERAYLYSDISPKNFPIAISKIIPEHNLKIFNESESSTTQMVRSTYSYESALPKYSYKLAQDLMKQDLARFFGIVGSIEDRQLECLVIKRLGSSDESKLWLKKSNSSEDDVQDEIINGSIKIRGVTVGRIASLLKEHNNNAADPVIIDETNFNQEERLNKKIDVTINLEQLRATPERIPIIEKELKKYGLGLINEVRKLKVLVLKSVF
jgi:thiol-disulfide isomerase/thioredoxin